MTWPRIAARFEFWREEPPAAVLLQILASFVGWKPPARTDAGAAAMDTLKSLFPSGKIRY